MNPEFLRNLSLVRQLVRRELTVKYRGSILGYLWSMLNPLLYMLILSFVFGHFMKGIPNYNLFILSGILAWNMGAQSISMATHSLVNNSSLLRKVKVSHWVFQLVPICSSFINFCLALIPFSIIYALSGRQTPAYLFLLPVFLILYFIFLLGIGLILGVLNVFFRDVGHMLEPVLQLCFYATPIIYDRRAPNIPEWVAQALSLNPFTWYIEAIKSGLYGGAAEHSLTAIFYLSIFSALSVLIGSAVYIKARRRFAFAL